MAIYEIDTLKQSLKKYVVVLAIGTGIGVYLSSCTFSTPKRTTTSDERTQRTEYDAGRYDDARPVREQTPEERRLAVFESYTSK